MCGIPLRSNTPVKSLDPKVLGAVSSIGTFCFVVRHNTETRDVNDEGRCTSSILMFVQSNLDTVACYTPLLPVYTTKASIAKMESLPASCFQRLTKGKIMVLRFLGNMKKLNYFP